MLAVNRRGATLWLPGRTLLVTGVFLATCGASGYDTSPSGTGSSETGPSDTGSSAETAVDWRVGLPVQCDNNTPVTVSYDGVPDLTVAYTFAVTNYAYGVGDTGSFYGTVEGAVAVPLLELAPRNLMG